MTIKELMEVCTSKVDMFMYDKNTGQNIQILVYDSNPIYQSFLRPYLNVLKVKELYSDNGLVAEIKFNKEFWRMHQKLKKLEEGE